MPSPPSEELDGLTVRLDDLRYQYGGPNVPPETPHVFIYFITIENNSNRSVKLLGRKWIIQDAEGETLVIEGDKIVGVQPAMDGPANEGALCIKGQFAFDFIQNADRLKKPLVRRDDACAALVTEACGGAPGHAEAQHEDVLSRELHRSTLSTVAQGATIVSAA